MVFSSLTFLLVFLPIVLVAYYITPNRYKNNILLIASLSFYGFGEPKYLFLLLFSCIINYLFALVIEKHKTKKILLILALMTNLSLLVYFKYIDFIITNINALFSTRLSLTYLILPIGISFFTFQCISYIVDVSRGKVKANRNILAFATYVTLFPQLIAGPIVRYRDIAQQLQQRTHTSAQFVQGMNRFIIGLSKKVLLANTMGDFITLMSTNSHTLMANWLIAFAFSFQLYFDFSGYSDMAIGLGHMFGFTFLENFNYPFIANSITNFWRRWHISLSSWFKDYVYIPLKGSRVKKGRLCLNLLIVWGLTGLWHGAQWNFILWGLYFALLLIIEKFFLLDWLHKHPYIAHMYTLFFVVMGFVIFRYDATQLTQRFLQLYSFNTPLFDEQSVYYLQSYGVLLMICVIASTPLLSIAYQKFIRNHAAYQYLVYGEYVLYLVLLIICLAFIVDSSFQPFLYFRF